MDIDFGGTKTHTTIMRVKNWPSTIYRCS